MLGNRGIDAVGHNACVLRVAAGLIGALSLLTATCAAAATAPPGPRLATISMLGTKGSERSENATPAIMSLATFGPLGGQRQQLLSGKLEGERVTPSPFYGPTWSADGNLIAFSGSSSKKGDERIYMISANGTGLRSVPGTRGAGNPVLSPDGDTVAFSRSRYHQFLDIKHITEPAKDRSRVYASTTTWTVDLGSSKPHRLTRWRNGLSNVPGSFSPDGSTLALTKEDDNLDGPRVMLIRSAEDGSLTLLRGGQEPAFSPDGTQLAFIGYLNPDLVEAEEDHDYLSPDLYAMSIDGGHIRRLTRSEDILESSPAWDPSGQRLGFLGTQADTSFVAGLALLFPFGNALMQINADGSCRQTITSIEKVALYGVSWQPGLGREAGRIVC